VYDVRTRSKGGRVSSLIERLTREVFRHHSNPWSAWTRLLSVPLVFVPVWTRSRRQGAFLGAWLMVNPIVFPDPKSDRAWATRAMLGEEMWIAERPLDRAMALNVGATAFGLGGVWGAYKRRLLPTAVCAVGQAALLLAYWREMVAYYERHRTKPPTTAQDVRLWPPE
jgi:hypothetical protein